MTKKRALDIVITGLAAVIWVPVLTLAALAVLVLSGRPVLYRSMRRVSNDDVLRIVKFRTMVKNAEALVNRSTVPIQNDVRFLNIAPDSPLYTRIGRLLERCGITEIPQLVHVLRGEMSIVGNRPLPENVVSALRDEYPTASDRFLTKSGLTGPAQLVGRSALTDLERLTLEGAYCRACVRRYSIWLDVSILFATVMIVIGIKKAYTYQGVLDLIDRRSRSSRRTLVTVVAEADEVIATEAV
ncbi:sugar transferase [Aeromicrobium sp. CFBP 8757]|uniref:sugar transferase n=1 Tax=Aeromicrobium sp. CFBP 8757 TaxID=2775288 RepID=UPI00177AC87E|nr:sugar transferase [Aeromicrobium sp. CFBP 8757]MBD8608244.1 sugar transferase [Aeromicrobium sp. CFBP 8757]